MVSGNGQSRRGLHPFLEELRSFDLPVGDFVVFGSAPLLVRGWITDARDLDVVARGAAWARAQELGTAEYLKEWDVVVVNIGRDITVGTRWAIGDVDTDSLIDGAELLMGLPFANLAAVVAYKRIADRPKDRVHLGIIEHHLPGEF